MTRQTATPIDHLSLAPTYREVYGQVQNILDGSLLLDPPYQRGSVWTLDQRIALVESWLRGLPAGVVILSDRSAGQWTDGDPYETGTGIWACVDGKQRLTTGLMWYASEFAVPASWFPADHVAETEDTEDGPYVRFTGLSDKGVRVVKRRCGVMLAETRDCATVADEARFYLLVNGGGTQQTDADMANAARVAGS